MKNSKLYDTANYISDLIILNLLWIIFSLPVFTLYSSTESLLHCIHLLRNNEGNSMFVEFWSEFKKHFLWLLINFLFSLAFIWSLYFDITLCIKHSSIITFIIAALLISAGLIFIITLIYMLLTIQYSDKNFFNLWKFSFLLGMANLPQSLIMIIILFATVIIAKIIPIAFVIILMSVAGLLIDTIYDKIKQKYIHSEE